MKRYGFKKSNISKYPLLLLPIFLFLVVFLVAPYIVILIMSITKEGVAGLTLLNYKKAFFDLYYFKILLNTILLGTGVTFLTLILGYPCGYFICVNVSTVQKSNFLSPECVLGRLF